MPNTFKVLGQSAPAANTATDLYTVPSATQVVVNTLVCANRGTSSGTVRVSVRPNGATAANQHIVVPDTTIAANDALNVADLIPPIDASDVVTVQASTANFSFTIGGCEITA